MHGCSSMARPEIDGLTLRTYRPGDAKANSELVNRVFEADDVPWRTDPDEQENWLSAANEHFDPTRDMFMVEVDGTLVANADTEWVDTTDGLREYRMGCMVDRGLAAPRDRDLAPAHAGGTRRRRSRRPNPTERPLAMGSWAADSESGSDRAADPVRVPAGALLLRHGAARAGRDRGARPAGAHRGATGERRADAPVVGGGHRGVPRSLGRVRRLGGALPAVDARPEVRSQPVRRSPGTATRSPAA